MRVSIVLEKQKDARDRTMAEVRKLGVEAGSVKESDIKLAIGEAFANCFQGKLCVENEAEVKVFGWDGDIVIMIIAPCYKDPKTVRGWFQRSCEDVDPSSECGRGDGLITKLAERIIYLPGSISFVFDLNAAAQVAA